jgi:hypothetical protein
MSEITDVKGKSKEDDDAAFLDEARKRFKLCEDGWKDNRLAALEDMKFRAGDQWPEKIKESREKSGRPCLVVDKLNQYVRQVVNDGRQNRPMVKVRPIDDYADDEVAEAFQGIIRHICDRSNADEAFDTALEQAVVGGWGWFRVATDYAHENTFNQEIEVIRIPNQLAVVCDPFTQKADKSDMRFCFVVDEMAKDEFKKQYPDAKFTNWESDGKQYGEDGWLTAESVRVAEYWHVVETPAKLLLMSDGTSVTEADYAKALEQGVTDLPQIVDEREITAKSVKWCRMSGAEKLEEIEWVGKYVPLIFVGGNEYNVDGKVIYSGLIRSAKDAMRLYNFSRSAYAERVALTPKAPWVADVKAIEGYEGDWTDANVENQSVLRYNSTDEAGQPLPMPQRNNPSDIPAGFAQDMQLSEHDIQAALGMYSASLGERSNEKSGRAIMARQREGDTATFHFQDNLSRAIRYLGRILVDLIPKIYDSRRVVRILGEDGESKPAIVDPQISGATQKQGNTYIYNLNAGLYDVSVAAGPNYTTKRQEAADAMMQLAQGNPNLFPLIGDVMVRNMDWPGADAIADRLKLMLPPEIKKAEENDDESPEVVALKQQAQQMLDQATQQIQAAEQGIQERDQAIAQLQQELQQAKQTNDLKAQEIQVKVFEAETERMQVEASLMQPVEQGVQQAARPSQPAAMVMVDGREELMAAASEMQLASASIQEVALQASQVTAQSAQALAEALQMMAQGQAMLAEAIATPKPSLFEM